MIISAGPLCLLLHSLLWLCLYFLPLVRTNDYIAPTWVIQHCYYFKIINLITPLDFLFLHVRLTHLQDLPTNIEIRVELTGFTICIMKYFIIKSMLMKLFKSSIITYSWWEKFGLFCSLLYFSFVFWCYDNHTIQKNVHSFVLFCFSITKNGWSK